MLKEESFPKPLLNVDVVRRTNTSLDILLESRIDAYWNVDSDRDLSEPLTRFTPFTIINEKPSDGDTWSGQAADNNSSDNKTRSFMARD